MWVKRENMNVDLNWADLGIWVCEHSCIPWFSCKSYHVSNSICCLYPKSIHYVSSEMIPSLTFISCFRRGWSPPGWLQEWAEDPRLAKESHISSWPPWLFQGRGWNNPSKATREWIPRSEDYWGPSWRLATQCGQWERKKVRRQHRPVGLVIPIPIASWFY